MSSQVLTLNVGGTLYTTTTTTLKHDPDSYLAKLLTNSSALRDVNHNLFIDRDPSLFRYILDYCRYGKLCIPRNFDELERLKEEATFYKLNKLVEIISKEMEPRYSCVTVGYRGTFSASRDGSTDLRFRKLARILVAGQTTECRRLFGDTLNDTRDPDTGSAYSSRFFLKHCILEQCFDVLYNDGYQLITACASGTSGVANEVKFIQDDEETRWQHYNEFIFVKRL
ncbi:hypothetical protein CRM22_005831 [Opisthorchis felineus]|uniref:BTB domain-containing protein n=1 Tax=Opisthorchis felineus TaxID=147828 RepID=A0A4S2LW63_OPIFE|nr:hypothetical protein CRM22_005831 [Opisthorchis felineus]